MNVLSKAANQEQALLAACKLHPQDKNVWYQLGKHEFDQGKLDDAFASLETACLLDPVFYPAIKLQAEIAQKLNRYQEARMLARRLIHTDANNPYGFSLLLDLCLAKPQDKNEASWVVRLAKIKAPHASTLFVEIGKRFTAEWGASKDPFWQKLAAECFNQCLKVDPNNISAREALAKPH